MTAEERKNPLVCRVGCWVAFGQQQDLHPAGPPSSHDEPVLTISSKLLFHTNPGSARDPSTQHSVCLLQGISFQWISTPAREFHTVEKTLPPQVKLLHHQSPQLPGMRALFPGWMLVACRDIKYAERWITHASLHIFAA